MQHCHQISHVTGPLPNAGSDYKWPLSFCVKRYHLPFDMPAGLWSSLSNSNVALTMAATGSRSSDFQQDQLHLLYVLGFTGGARKKCLLPRSNLMYCFPILIHAPTADVCVGILCLFPLQLNSDYYVEGSRRRDSKHYVVGNWNATDYSHI